MKTPSSTAAPRKPKATLEKYDAFYWDLRTYYTAFRATTKAKAINYATTQAEINNWPAPHANSAKSYLRRLDREGVKRGGGTNFANPHREVRKEACRGQD